MTPPGRAAGARAPGRGGRVQLRRRLQRQPAGACASGPHQAWVQISVGCNCVCAYCIVPSVRGRERSRPLADVVDEVERAGRRRGARGDAARAERELLRAGPAPRRAGDLRRAAAGGRRRRRASGASATPAPIPRTCAPTSSPRWPSAPRCASTCTCRPSPGSTRVLKAMRRTYSRERYLELVARLRDAIPDLSLTTDLIVGFPGETEAGLRARRCRLVEECGYDGAYTFLYSPRPGTEAGERLADDVAAGGQARAHRAPGGGGAGARRRGARRRFVGSDRARCWSRGRRAPTPRGCAGACARTSRSTSPAIGRAGIAGPGAVDGSTSTTLSGHQVGRAARRRRPSPPPEVLALFGPTAAGKSALAHAAALALGGEIVVADPFQRYRGLEIAADSPRAAQLAEVPHHGVGDLDARPRRSTAAGFARVAHAAIDARPRRRARAGRRAAAPGSTCAPRWPIWASRTSAEPELRDVGRGAWRSTTPPAALARARRARPGARPSASTPPTRAALARALRGGRRRRRPRRGR